MDVSAHDLIETVREGLVVLAADMTVVSANRSFYSMFRVVPDDTIGRRLYDLGDGEWDIPELRTLLEKVLPAETSVQSYEVDHVFPVIGRRIVELNARRVLRPGNDTEFILLTFHDITDIQLERLRAERAAWIAQTIVDTVRDPLVILDEDMRITMASRNFVRMFGDAEAELAGHRLEELKQGQWDVPALRALLERVVPENAPFDDFLVENEFPDLGHRIFKLNARKIHEPGNHSTQLLLAFEDATDATLLERHKEMLAAELAHRVKNSLQFISAFVGVELRRASEPCAEGYRAMQSRIAAVAELYDLMAQSSAFGPVDMPSYFDGIASGLRASLLGSASGIEIAVDVEPLRVAAEHAVPVGLLVNELATNAVKHAFPGGSGRVVLGFRRRDGEVTITVQDDGAGMTGAEPPAKGSGTGARFVDAFAKQIGGTLAHSTGPGGTTVTVRFPTSLLF